MGLEIAWSATAGGEDVIMWYYAQGENRLGPLDQGAFDRAVAGGLVTDSTLVWRDGMSDWQPWHVVRSTAGPASAGGNAACASCGQEFPVSEMVAYAGQHVCASCKPLYFQRLREGVNLPGTYVYAGFWVRFVAKFVDGIITGILGFVLQFLLMFAIGSSDPNDPQVGVMLISTLGGIGIGLAYQLYFLVNHGATPGKMAMGLKVIRPMGEPITYGRAMGRFFAEWLSGIILYIGYIMVAFDDEKRSLHDRICDTRVVKA